jgi:hypothetical protein
MTDWVYETCSAQAQLEDALTKIAKLEKDNRLMRAALRAIVNDAVEDETILIELQRNGFITMARYGLGMELIRQL